MPSRSNFEKKPGMLYHTKTTALNTTATADAIIIIIIIITNTTNSTTTTNNNTTTTTSNYKYDYRMTKFTCFIHKCYVLCLNLS